MGEPGPRTMGRGLVAPPGAPVPEPWREAPEVVVDEAAVADPRPVADVLHPLWAARTPVVVRLAVPIGATKEPEVDARPVWEVGPGGELSRERLHFLVWANNYDGRGLAEGRPLAWPHAAAAGRLDGVTVGGPADVVLPDGSPAWVDGGPRQSWPDPALLDGHAVLHRDTYERGRTAAPPGRQRHAAALALADDQLEAVVHERGPARIIAPAGSGKTRVLTERLRHLLADRGYERDSVLALAYNVRAKDEMVERTTDISPRVMTLNGCALAICQAASPGVRTIEEREVRRLLEPFLPRQRHTPNTDPMAPYLDALSRTRLSLADPAEIEAADGDLDGFADAFHRYRKELARIDRVDFDEQIVRAVEILLQEPAVRRRFQSGARHLLVDEFQDLTPAHLLLVRLLSAPAYEVFGVGDDDQVIYGYAGADPRFLIDYERWFPGAAAHALRVNYRCPPAVVAAAGTLLGYGRTRVAKEIVAAPGREGDDADLQVVERPRADEGPGVVATVREWLDSGVASGEIAVLGRVNSILLPAQVLLSEAGVACHGPLDARVLARTGMSAALAYVQMAIDPGKIDRALIDATVRRPSRKIAPQVLEMMKKRPRTSVGELRRLSDHLEKDGPKVASYVADIDRLAAAAKKGATTAELLRIVREDIGLGEAMDTLDGAGAARTAAAHGDDLLALEQVAAAHPEPASFEEWLREVLARGPAPGGVTLSTIHRVKGREWDRVVVIGVSGGLLPHRLSEDEEEERRIFHVGITRGRERVVVMGDVADPSPFLAEMAGTAAVRPARPARAPRSTGAAAGPGSGGGARAPKLVRTSPVERTPRQDAAMAALRAWRLGKAKANGAPAYTVFADATLEAIVARWPASLAELAGVTGIGPAKLERYGDEVLGVLDDIPDLEHEGVVP